MGGHPHSTCTCLLLLIVHSKRIDECCCCTFENPCTCNNINFLLVPVHTPYPFHPMPIDNLWCSVACARLPNRLYRYIYTLTMFTTQTDKHRAGATTANLIFILIYLEVMGPHHLRGKKTSLREEITHDTLLLTTKMAYNCTYPHKFLSRSLLLSSA